MTFAEVEKFYIEGKKIDLRRRGFEIEEKPTQEDRERDYDLYYTEEEKKKIKEFYGKKKVNDSK